MESLRGDSKKQNNNEIDAEEGPMLSSRPEDEEEEKVRLEMRDASMSEYILESYPQAGFQIYLMGVLHITSKYLIKVSGYYLENPIRNLG